MSKNQNSIVEEYNDSDLGDVYDQEITNRDYGFVFDSDGDLKSVFMPTDYFEIPERVLDVFKMFGIDNPEGITVHDVH